MASESFLKYVVSFLVEKPDSVIVKEINTEDSNVIELRVAPEDIGKVIGRNGRIARSLRTLVTAAGIKEGKNYTLEIID